MSRIRPRYLSLCIWLTGGTICVMLLMIYGSVDSNMRTFLPPADSLPQKVLLQQLEHGDTVRLLIIAIEGGGPAQLANSSNRLLQALSTEPDIKQVSNSNNNLAEATAAWLFQNRYQLSAQASDRLNNHLRSELQERFNELVAGINLLTMEMLARDPTLEFLRIARQLRSQVEPHEAYGVWMNKAETRALLVITTRFSAYQLNEQQQIIERIRAVFASQTNGVQRLLITGPGVFAVESRRVIKRDTKILSVIASIGITLLLLAAYRSVPVILVVALPLGLGLLAGATIVVVIFGSIHGIALAFAITTLGVALDYPVHMFSHMRSNSAQTTVSKLWPTLRLGLITTVIGYSALLMSDFNGLKQLGVFSIAGLITAAMATRWLLPALLLNQSIRRGQSFIYPRMDISVGWRLLLLILFGVVTTISLVKQTPWLARDLVKLSPIPIATATLDKQLRSELGVPEVGHLLLQTGDSAQQLLAQQEQLLPVLGDLQRKGIITGFDNAVRYLPSVKLQQSRLAALPDTDALRALLAEALENLPLRQQPFQVLLADVLNAQKKGPISYVDALFSPLGSRLLALLYQNQDRWIGVTTLSRVTDPEAVADRVKAFGGGDTQYMNMREVTDAMVLSFIYDAIYYFITLAIIVICVLMVGLRDIVRTFKVISVVALSLIVDVAVLHLVGEAISVFHVVALLLVFGVGLDYALFFSLPGSVETRQDTFHALSICCLSTVLVFAVLATSDLPVLRAIAQTVSIGVVLSFVSAFVLSRPSPRRNV